jgi:ATP/ADP translocase
MLGSGFWLLASEGFDPHTAKKRFGQIMGAGTLGGLVGGLLAERVAVVSGIGVMLLVLAVLNVICVVLTWRLGAASPGLLQQPAAEIPSDLAPAAASSGLRTLHDPYLRSLALLVLLGTAAVSLVDYLFKVDAAQTLGAGGNLLRFFAIFYAATSLVTFAVQTTASGTAVDRLASAGWRVRRHSR